MENSRTKKKTIEKAMNEATKETKMSKVTTKEKLLDSALTLFAERGYDGVGVDLIAERAGVKGPSIYKHFKGKEQLFEVLLDQVENYYTTNFGSAVNIGKLPDSVEELIEQSMERVRFTLHDEKIKKIRKILAMEQYRNSRIAGLATKHSMDSIQSMYEKIFSEMKKKGILDTEDPHMLAMSFTAPITLLIQMCDREPQREQEAMDEIRSYLNYAISPAVKERRT